MIAGRHVLPILNQRTGAIWGINYRTEFLYLAIAAFYRVRFLLPLELGPLRGSGLLLRTCGRPSFALERGTGYSERPLAICQNRPESELFSSGQSLANHRCLLAKHGATAYLHATNAMQCNAMLWRPHLINRAYPSRQMARFVVRMNLRFIWSVARTHGGPMESTTVLHCRVRDM